METLAQTPQTSQSALEKIIEQLKNASQDTLEQVRAFFQNTSEADPAVETPVAETTAPLEESLDNDTTLDVAAEAIDDAGEVAPEAEAAIADLGLESEAATEEAPAESLEEELSTEALQNEISSDDTENAAIDVLIGEAPKADIEIRLDEIYSIRVVANEVVSSIEELQNEVAALRAQVSEAVLEAKVKEMVAAALRERFV